MLGRLGLNVPVSWPAKGSTPVLSKGLAVIMDDSKIEFQKQIPLSDKSLACCLLGNVVAGFIGDTEARDWFTCGGNNGTVGTPKIKHIKSF